jgi:hypothetical protein
MKLPAKKEQLHAYRKDTGEPTGLVPVTIVDQQRQAVHRKTQVQIMTPGGFVLRFDSSLPESELASLVRAIEPAHSGHSR